LRTTGQPVAVDRQKRAKTVTETWVAVVWTETGGRQQMTIAGARLRLFAGVLPGFDCFHTKGTS
jgi:hypothetical protein